MTEHKSFWDCHESESTKRSIKRLVPPETRKASCDKVEIYTCKECGKKHVLEIWKDETKMNNRYGLKRPKEITFSEILEWYGIEY